MKNHMLSILFGVLSGIVFSQTPSDLYQAHDYVYVGEYTQGLEGPAVDVFGNLYFVNPNHQGSIGKIDADRNFSLWIDSLPHGSVANGIRISRKGTLLLADYTNHNVLRIDPTTKKISIYAHLAQANQPNDLAICCGDRLYASDPNWKEGTGKLWMIEKDQITLLDDEMGTTNGIEVSPDHKRLYVNESVQLKVWVFDILPDGHLTNKRLHIHFEDYGFDGMRVDSEENLYITRYGKGTIVQVSKEGKILREIPTKGKKVSNLAFGGNDGKTIYVTTQDRGWIESFRVEHPGRSFVEQTKGL
ncbi:MAG: SMP-30/gluconolactonase/LRE family protein [Flavobacteriaceae bacterium]|nr:SMP-30/gluconolactonase/LRE family protein [Flavobacteriaceae bacterium]